MGEVKKRILWRSVGVALALGLMGYLFAEVYLTLVKMNGGVQDPANEVVRWRTPLTMAGLGVLLQIIIELIAGVIRRRKPLPAAPADGSPMAPREPDARLAADAGFSFQREPDATCRNAAG